VDLMLASLRLWISTKLIWNGPPIMSVTFICTSPSANALNVRTKYFLPFLLKKKSSIMYTTSGLALVPIARCPNYNATKAALHQFIMSIRRQLKTSSVKVIELFPPAVQTELHDAKHQPTIENGGQIGITMDEFMETAWAGIVEGKEEIPVGFAWKRSMDQGRQ
jgi:short-subunit dehydrogenase involved in D-alanine esterification of teichoic acids